MVTEGSLSLCVLRQGEFELQRQGRTVWAGRDLSKFKAFDFFSGEEMGNTQSRPVQC